MANSCLQMSGFLLSCLGWVGIVIATSTNDWVMMCKYGLNTCKKMDELGEKGPWADCVISTGIYHCYSLTQILELPAYIQTTRALMITGSILGLPAAIICLMSMPCINLGNEPQSSKNKRTILGGVLIIIVASLPRSPEMLLLMLVTDCSIRHGHPPLIRPSHKTRDEKGEFGVGVASPSGLTELQQAPRSSRGGGEEEAEQHGTGLREGGTFGGVFLQVRA
ncbi:claudin-11-like [Halichoeres trimaculatus]|uniref:claudin-11-like n=1 Tax=Halichoeres trimaculatus TaxID=147232 RepID=UPI003D9EB71C